MTPKQKLIIQATFEQIQPKLLTVTDRFYARLFRQNPELKDLFTKKRDRQVQDFSEALGEIIRRLDTPNELGAYLRTLSKRHEAFDVGEDHYVEVGKAYVFAIRHTLGQNFNRSVANAWNRFFREIGKLVTVQKA